MTEQQIKDKALEAYPIHNVALPYCLTPKDMNSDTREGYIKALEDIEKLPKIPGWITRDKDGSVWFHYTKPTRNEEEGYWASEISTPPMEIYHVEFPDLTWESEPLETELIIRIS